MDRCVRRECRRRTRSARWRWRMVWWMCRRRRRCPLVRRCACCAGDFSSLVARRSDCRFVSFSQNTWQASAIGLPTPRSLKVRRASVRQRSNVREPRERRGRLRHCIGLQTPKATGREAGKAGARHEARSQDTGWIALVRPRESAATSPQREGWGQPTEQFPPGSCALPSTPICGV